MPTNVAPHRMVTSSHRFISFTFPSAMEAYALTIDTDEQISRKVLNAVIWMLRTLPGIQITAFNTFLLICSSVLNAVIWMLRTLPGCAHGLGDDPKRRMM